MFIKKKKTMTLVAVISLVLITIVFSAYAYLQNILEQRIIITNNSIYTIDLVDISYSNEKLILNDIPIKSSVSKKIIANNDGSFNVRILFSDGFEIKENNLGYITHGDGSDNVFLITKDKKLIFKQKY